MLLYTDACGRLLELLGEAVVGMSRGTEGAEQLSAGRP